MARRVVGLALALGVAALALWGVARLLGPASRDGAVRAAVPSRNVLVVGLDGADWDIIEPLFATGELPNLRRLTEEGARARLRTIAPALSPVVWTSVATGKVPAKHGILDFLAASSDGSLVPVTSTLWQARSLWSIVGDAGVPVAVTAWWATWPAEPVHGLLATDRIAYQLFREVIDGDDADGRGKTWPPELFDDIAPRIVLPSAIGDGDLARLVDFDALGAPDEDDARRLDELRTVVASTRTYEAIARELLAREPRGLHCVYNESTDTAAHLFMEFRPPLRPGVDARRAAAYGGVVDAVYREADAMIGRMLEATGSGWNVVVLSDHGFRHGDNRPSTDPRIGHGPAADWHDRFGVLVLWGPDVRRGVRIADATVLDVAPTVLALYGLPLGDDMDGRVLEEALEPAFLAAHPVERIPTHEPEDRGPRDVAGLEPTERDDELMEKLRALGYLGAGAGEGEGEVDAEFTQESARAHNNRGISLLGGGDIDGAIAEFEKGLAAGGGVQSRVNLANAHLIRGDLDAAERVLAELEAERPELRALPALRGRLADLRGRDDEALGHLREAVRRDPSDSRSLARLAHLLEQRGRLDEALEAYRAAARADPDSAQAHTYVGNVLRLHGDHEGAEAAYRRSLEADPRYPGAYNNLGLLLQRAGRRREAIELYRRGLEQAPRSALLHNSLAGALLLERELDEAERVIDALLELDPQLPEARNNLGILRALQGRPAEARRHFEEALALDPDSVDAHFNLAKALLLERDVRGAQRHFARASALAPGHLEAAIGAGETAYRLGLHDEAIRWFEQSKRIDPRIARVRRELGELYLARGDRERAIREWQQSLALAPDQPELRARLTELAPSRAGNPRDETAR